MKFTLLPKVRVQFEIALCLLDVNQRRAVGTIGEPTILLEGERFAETYSITCLCSLDPDPRKSLFIDVVQVIDEQMNVSR